MGSTSVSGREVVMVIILRRDESDLSTVERQAIVTAFPHKEVIFRRMDPRDCYEHARLCEQLGSTHVILPRERPIPSVAMEQGVHHLTVFSDGRVMELKPFVPTFKPFEPK